MFFSINLEKLETAIEVALAATAKEREEKNYHEFIQIMSELDWPLFLEYDPWLHEETIRLHAKGDEKAIQDLILDYLDWGYLRSFSLRCKTSTVIAAERKPLFEEVIKLYQARRYYGVVAILVTQLAGIVSDIEKYMDEHGMTHALHNRELLEKRYHIQPKSDKGRTVSALLEGRRLNNSCGEYDYLIGYFRWKVFGAHLNAEEVDKHVNRHMVCHGEQIAYGTKEHALKILLCVDALVWIAEVISSNIDE